MLTADIQDLETLETIDGEAWCKCCKKTTKHKVGFDIAYDGIICQCRECFSINGFMTANKAEKYIREQKAKHRKVYISVLEEINRDNTPIEAKEFVESINERLK